MESIDQEEDNQTLIFRIACQQRLGFLKNTFKLIFGMEISVIITQLFAISFVQLYSPNNEFENILWISFIYSCYQNDCFLNKNLCQKMSQLDNCYDCKNQNEQYFRYIILFIIILILILMLNDVIRLYKIQLQLKIQILEEHLVEISTNYQKCILLMLIVIYLAIFFNIIIIEKTCSWYFGAAFWVGVSGITFYLIIILYCQYLKGRFVRTKYFEQLLKQETSQSSTIEKYMSFPSNQESINQEQFYSLKNKLSISISN